MKLKNVIDITLIFAIIVIAIAFLYGFLAQLVEQLTLNQWVWGSSPQESTSLKEAYASFLFFF